MVFLFSFLLINYLFYASVYISKMSNNVEKALLIKVFIVRSVMRRNGLKH